MFALFLFAFFPTAFAALQVAPPTGAVRSSSPVTITWTSENGDPPFSIELINLSFNHAYAIANNVDPNEKSRTISFPEVPAGDGYSIQFVNIANIDDVYSATGDFAIEDAITTSSSSTTVASSSSDTGATATPTISHTPTASSGFGTTKAGGNTSSSQISASASASPSNAAGTLGAPSVMGIVAGLFAWLAL